jgi:hypothetical protein
MPSTYSPSLRIELVGTGEQDGYWGDSTNNNLGTLIEQAIAGVVSIPMIDANYTLTNYNGLTDESRNAVLVVSGTNAAVRKVVAPLVEKVYIVKNSTTGGFAITIGASTGDPVTINNGDTVTVYCNGTNFYAGSIGSVSPIFTGVPAVPTAAANTSTTQVASTEYVVNQITSQAQLKLTNWTTTQVGTKLVFSYNSVAKASLDSSGNMIIAGTLTQSGTP